MRAEAALYGQHFGLTQAPFRATPDPRFFYSNPVYREAYATLLYGVLQRKGFIALTGEIGTGKTTLLRRLMDELGPPVRFVLFYNTTLTFDETVEFICGELELPVTGLSRVQRLQRLNDLLIAEARQGGNVVLLIDEAQNLGPDVLENLRLISNLETATEKLLQIVLVGQPELDGKLADPTLRQVSQRIAIRYRLEPLRDHEIGSFIDHRLRQCGATRRALFTADAIQRISAYSRGVPRLINILCDGALLAGYAAGTRLGKRYVSLYLMGVYASPGIVAGLSPELRARMQGKSCFNFTTIDEGLFEEVSGVIRRSMSGFDEVARRIDRERSKTPKGRAPAV